MSILWNETQDGDLSNVTCCIGHPSPTLSLDLGSNWVLGVWRGDEVDVFDPFGFVVPVGLAVDHMTLTYEPLVSGAEWTTGFGIGDFHITNEIGLGNFTFEVVPSLQSGMVHVQTMFESAMPLQAGDYLDWHSFFASPTYGTANLETAYAWDIHAVTANQAHPVPEPGALWLFAGALLMWCGLRVAKRGVLVGM